MKNFSNKSLSEFQFPFKLPIILFQIFCFLTLSSCSLMRPEIDSGFRFRSASPEEFLQIEKLLNSSEPEIERTRVKALLELSKDIFKQSFRFALVSKSPDLLRLELFTMGFPKLVSLFVTGKGYSTVYDAREKLIFHGPSDSKVLERLLGLPFSADELMHWSIGRFPPTVVAGTKKIYVSKNFTDDRTFKIQIETNPKGLWSHIGKIKTCDLKECTRLLRSQFSKRKRKIFYSEFSYPSDLENRILIPNSLSFRLYPREFQGKLKVSKVQINSDVKAEKVNLEDLFSVVYPKDARILPLEDYKGQ